MNKSTNSNRKFVQLIWHELMNEYLRGFDYKGTCVIEFIYEKLNFINSDEALDQIRNIINEFNLPAVILVLDNIRHINSVGMGLLIAIKNICAKKGFDIYLVCKQVEIIKIFRLTKMEIFFNIFETLDETVQWITNKVN